VEGIIDDVILQNIVGIVKVRSWIALSLNTKLKIGTIKRIVDTEVTDLEFISYVHAQREISKIMLIVLRHSNSRLNNLNWTHLRIMSLSISIQSENFSCRSSQEIYGNPFTKTKQQ
jgi:hypothetical protein